MKKGFTLIEVLAVIIVIAIISTVSVLSINYSIERTKERLYYEQIERLESSLRGWSIENINSLPVDQEGIFFFDIDRFKAEGIINTDEIIDPRTNEELKGCIVVTYNEDYSQYNFDYTEDDCDTASESYMPIISISGGTNQTVEVNERYVLPEVSATDYLGNPLNVIGPLIKNDEGEIVRSIETNVLSEKSNPYDYEILYRVVDENLKLETEEIVYLKVDDTTSPTIEILESTRPSSIVHEAGHAFSIPDMNLNDNSCDEEDPSINRCDVELFDLDQVVVTTNLDLHMVGQYSLTYTVSDWYGNERSLSLNVEIEDTTPPTVPTFELRLNNSSGSMYDSSWTNENVWLGNVEANDIGVGVDRYEYTLNCDATNPTWQEYTNPITFNTTREDELCLRAIDYEGNVSEASSMRSLLIDKDIPTAPSISGASTSWTNGSRTISISGGNPGPSGVDRYQYRTRLSGDSWGSWTNYSSSITYDSEMDREIQARIIDNAGNTGSATSTRYIRIDRTNPSVSCSPTSTSWGNSNVSVSVSVSDSLSGLSSVRSRTSSNNGSSWGSWTNRAGSFTQTFSSNGTHRVNIEAIDNANNPRVVDCGPYRVDQTAPTASFSPNSQTSWNNNNVSVSISASDSGGSGYRRMRTRVSSNNGSSYGSWSSYTTSSSTSRTLSGSGEHRIQVQVEDHAGNVSTLTSGVYRIDQTNPTAPSISGGSTTWTNGNRTISISGGNAGPSGRDRYQYRTRPSGGSWGSWTNYSSSITYSSTTNIEIQARVVDNAGNTGSASSTAHVRIDKTNPNVSFSPTSSSWGNSNVVVTVTGSDSGGSGYRRMRIRTSSNDGSSYGSWSSYSTSTSVNRTLSSTGINRIQVEVEDNAGNTRTVTSGRYRIDKTSPTVSFSPSSQTSWGNSAVTVTVTGSDSGGSGYRRMRIRTSTNDGSSYGSWSSYSTSTSVNRNLSGSGTYRVQVQVEDNAGNTNTVTSGRFRIDRVTPTITYSPNSNSTWSTSHSTVLSGSPGISGTNTFRYIWASSSSPSSSSIIYNHTSGTTRTYNSAIQGTRYLWARLCDGAGNCRMTSSGGFRIDNTIPTINSVTCSYHSVSQQFRVNFSASSSSGIARYSARFDGVTRSSTTSSLLTWSIPSHSAPAGTVTIQNIQIRNNTGRETNTSRTCSITHFSN